MRNFNLQKELAERSEKDWVFGAMSQPGIVSVPVNERDTWLPQGETQFDNVTDFNDCATRSPLNHLEALFTYHYQHAMKPENKKWLEDNGYVVSGIVTFSDRYIAVLSGTTHNGNSLKAPLEAIRTQGLIPKRLLPKTDTMTWEEYYAPISQPLKDLGAAFLQRFTINYEQVNQIHFGDALESDMLGVAAYAWNKPVNGVYQRVDGNTFNHAFLLYKLPKFQIYDNYYDFKDDGEQIVGKFTKNLAPNYEFFEYGYRVYISAEKTTKHVFLRNLSFGQSDSEVPYLQQALVALGFPIPHAATVYFGQETKDALALFQKSKGIVDDGSNCGPRTRLALNTPGVGIMDTIILAFRTFIGL